MVRHWLHVHRPLASRQVHTSGLGRAEQLVFIRQVTVSKEVCMKPGVVPGGVPLQDEQVLEVEPRPVPQVATDGVHPAQSLAVVSSHVVDGDQHPRLDQVQSAHDVGHVVAHAVGAVVGLAWLAVEEYHSVLVTPGRRPGVLAVPPRCTTITRPVTDLFEETAV